MENCAPTPGGVPSLPPDAWLCRPWTGSLCSGTSAPTSAFQTSRCPPKEPEKEPRPLISEGDYRPPSAKHRVLREIFQARGCLSGTPCMVDI